MRREMVECTSRNDEKKNGRVYVTNCLEDEWYSVLHELIRRETVDCTSRTDERRNDTVYVLNCREEE